MTGNSPNTLIAGAECLYEGRNSSGNPGLKCLTSVVTFFVEADEHVTGLQLHFCKLQQEGKTGEKHGKQNTLMNHRRDVTECEEREAFMPAEARFYNTRHRINAA